MNKMSFVAITAVLLMTSFSAYSSQRTGGDDAYYIETREGVTNNVVIDWRNPRGGNGYNGPEHTKDVTIYYVQPEYEAGDNQPTRSVN